MPNFFLSFFPWPLCLLPSPHRTGRDSDTMFPLYMRDQNVEVTNFLLTQARRRKLEICDPVEADGP